MPGGPPERTTRGRLSNTTGARTTLGPGLTWTTRCGTRASSSREQLLPSSAPRAHWHAAAARLALPHREQRLIPSCASAHAARRRRSASDAFHAFIARARADRPKTTTQVPDVGSWGSTALALPSGLSPPLEEGRLSSQPACLPSPSRQHPFVLSSVCSAACPHVPCRAQAREYPRIAESFPPAAFVTQMKARFVFKHQILQTTDKKQALLGPAGGLVARSWRHAPTDARPSHRSVARQAVRAAQPAIAHDFSAVGAARARCQRMRAPR